LNFEIGIEIAFNHIRNIRECKVLKFEIELGIEVAPALGIAATSFLKGD
jgi:hypothetical protein